MTGRFLTPLCTQDLPGNRWLLLAPLVYETAAGELIVVPAGFVCDLTSWCVTDDGDWGAAVHDFLYKHPVVNGRPIDRGRADAIYREALNAPLIDERGRQVPPQLNRARRFGRWLGVRTAGFFAWHGHRRAERAEAFS